MGNNTEGKLSVVASLQDMPQRPPYIWCDPTSNKADMCNQKIIVIRTVCKFQGQVIKDILTSTLLSLGPLALGEATDQISCEDAQERIFLWRSLLVKELRPPANSHHQLTNHVSPPSWKWTFLSHSSLHMRLQPWLISVCNLMRDPELQPPR